MIVLFPVPFQRSIEEVTKLSKFLGYNESHAFCREVVEMCSLDNMKKLEKNRPHYYGIEWKEGKEGITREGKIPNNSTMVILPNS